jgi:hypothetical protein
MSEKEIDTSQGEICKPSIPARPFACTWRWLHRQQRGRVTTIIDLISADGNAQNV